jgi:hypothetical protein
MNQENQSFDELVDRWVCAAVNNGVTNFNSLLNSLPGVYPSVALCSLKRLAAAGKVSEGFFSIGTQKRNKNAQKINRSQLGDNDILPIPHPLNYDWRFSDSATKYLLDYCLEATKETETVVCLGTPSLFQKANETLADVSLFGRQFDLMKRLLTTGIDIYAYATFTTPSSIGIEDDMRRFVDELQELNENLPLRTVPLQVEVFTPVQKRLDVEKKQALKYQWLAVETWQKEMENRFSSEQRALNIADVPIKS